jgi:hypothetical protein
MLETKEQSQEDWHMVIETEEWSSTAGLFHERKIRFEKEAIVILSNKALSEGS